MSPPIASLALACAAVLAACTAGTASRAPSPGAGGSPAGHGPAAIRLALGEAPVITGARAPAGRTFGMPAAAARAADGELLVFTVWFGQAPGDQVVTLGRSRDGRTWDAGHGAVYTDLGLGLTRPGPIPQAALQLDDGAWQLYGWGALPSRPSSFFSWRASAPRPEGPWTVDAPHILDPGPSGNWDDETAAVSSVVRDGAGYRMWFDGQRPGRQVRGGIGFASSADGLAWTRWDDPATGTPELAASDPVIAPGACGGGTAIATLSAQVAPWRGGLLALFGGHATATSRLAVFGATSADGAHWTCVSEEPLIDGADIPGGEGIHTIKAIPLGEGRIGLLLESLGAGSSEIWLAEVEAVG